MKPIWLSAILAIATTGAQAAVTLGSHTFDDNAFVDTVTSFTGSAMYDGSVYANPQSAPDPVTDIDATTFYATAPYLGYNDVTLGLGFSDNSAYNGSGADLAFLFTWDQTGNTLDLTINGTTASLAPQTLFGCGSPSTQCVLDGMIWNGNTLNNQYLGIALVDLSDFGVAAGAALAGDMQLHLVEGGSKPVVLNLAGAFYTSAPTTVVPVPAAVWLFGSGLLGLAGLARRR